MRVSLLLLLVIAGCGGQADESTCEEVADHMLDILTLPPIDAGAGVPAPSAAAAKAAEEQRKKFLAGSTGRTHLLERCKSSMSAAQAKCILAAQSEKALAACGQ